MPTREPLPALQPSDFADAFPNSRKVYAEAGALRVPMREITLGGDEPPLRVYDTSGPRGYDVRQGLPALRRDWIAARGDVVQGSGALRGSGAVTQLHYARKGVVTPEMEFI